MADQNDMWDDNDLSPRDPTLPIFFVDRQCILCSVCADAAPHNFHLSAEDDHNVVYQQPADPSDAIGRLHQEGTTNA